MKWAGQTLIQGLNSRWTASHSMPDNPKRQSWIRQTVNTGSPKRMRETPTETRATPTLSTCFASAPSLRLSDRCMIPSGFTASSSSARQVVSTSGKSCACVNSPVGDIEATRYVRWNSNRASRHFWAGVRLRISPRAVQVHVLPTYVAGAGRSLRAESWPAASHSEGKRIGRI